jgi:hypothetical protein
MYRSFFGEGDLSTLKNLHSRFLLLNSAFSSSAACAVIILCAAGHFAASVFTFGGHPLARKTFHRYVVRAKQGGVFSSTFPPCD